MFAAGTATASAAGYQIDVFGDGASQTGELITEDVTTPYIDMWHYSGGYWSGNWFDRKYQDDEMRKFFTPIDKKDSDALSYDTKGMTVEFELYIPDAVRDYAGYWNDKTAYNDAVLIKIDNLADKNIYFNPNDPADPNNPQAKIEGEKLYIRAIPRFFVTTEDVFKNYAAVNKQIPIPAQGYGINLYSMYENNSSKHLGRAEGTFKSYKDAPTRIRYTQIADVQGHLIVDENNPNAPIDVLDDDANGTGLVSQYNSANIRIGNNTFNNAGAVGMHYEYPLKVSYYKNPNMAIATQVKRRYIDKSTGDVMYEDTVEGKTLYGENDGTKMVLECMDWEGYSFSGWYSTYLDGSPDDSRTNRPAVISLDSANPNKILNIEYIPDGNPPPHVPDSDDNPNGEDEKLPDDGDEVIIKPSFDGCSDTVVWEEKTKSHSVITGYKSNGSPIRKSCRDTYTYEAKAQITDVTVSPSTLKSGYGFSVDVTAQIKSELVNASSSNEYCDRLDWNRKPTSLPPMPDNATVWLDYTVYSRLYNQTQGSGVQLEKVSETKNGDVVTVTWRTAVNPISVTGDRVILTDIALAGTKENPVTHNFTVWIKSGNGGAGEFCVSADGAFTINGNMFEDDKTTD